jgi:rod shape determining protein RodA
MRQYFRELRDFFRKGDLILLLLCLITSAFGVIMIASAKNYMGNVRFIIIQVAAIAIGILAYVIVSAIDADFMSEYRMVFIGLSVFVLLLLIPFGTDLGSGNRSWLDFPFLPIDIQPAEICKITYILIMASVMKSHQSRISSLRSVMHMVFHLGLLVGLNMVVSRDAGVSLIFVFVFVGMAFAGGVSLLWYLLAIGGVAAVWPFLWDNVLGEHQKNRIMVLIDPSIDAEGVDARFHTVRSLRSLTGGLWAGQGLYQGNRTKNGELFAQHTDYIFSAIGEELGFLGCTAVLVALFLIVFRCIQVGSRSQDYMRRMVCFGAASALMFQIIINVGMCIGVAPVIGLTLPFISYGGSSIVTLYAMLGLVSGVHARPEAPSHALYIQPKR